MAWQDILAEGEAVLKGETVLPYWRTDRRDDVEKVVGRDGPRHQRPQAVRRPRADGRGALDTGRGRAALSREKDGWPNGRNWGQFFRLLGGDAPLYALWFN